ncbi:MAG: hypothetical protein R3A47_10875 [Polyangiales bacterium]
MRIELSCRLPQRPQWVWERVRRSETLEFITAPLMKFEPTSGRFPSVWTAGNYEAQMRLFGVIPIGKQTIGIEYPEGEAGWIVRDNGHGQLIKRWDHWIFIEPEGEVARYTDRVDVSAGWLTPFVGLFARFFYAHRQRRWRELAARDNQAFD